MAKKCILFYAVLSSKPKAAQAHLAAATKQWHTQHGQAFPRLARKQFDPQFYPVPVVSNEVTSKQSATNVCCRMEKDLPQGLEDDQAINLKSLYKSMQRRMKAVVDAQSGHLDY